MSSKGRKEKERDLGEQPSQNEPSAGNFDVFTGTFHFAINQHSSLVILNNNHTHLGLLPASVVILPTILKHFDWLRRIFFSTQRVLSHFSCSVFFELFPTTEHMEEALSSYVVTQLIPFSKN